jgi:hypothetical protein
MSFQTIYSINYGFVYLYILTEHPIFRIPHFFEKYPILLNLIKFYKSAIQYFALFPFSVV